MALIFWSQDSTAWPGGLFHWGPQSSGCSCSPEKGKKQGSCFPCTDMRACAQKGQPAQMHGQKQTSTSSDTSSRSSLQALVHGRLGSPSGRTPWTSCPVTWLFGVETGGKLTHPGEELWGLRWGGPVAESSHQSVQASTQAGNRESSSQSCGRIGNVGALFSSDKSALSLLGRGQEPASQIPHPVPSFVSQCGF